MARQPVYVDSHEASYVSFVLPCSCAKPLAVQRLAAVSPVSVSHHSVSAKPINIDFRVVTSDLFLCTAIHSFHHQHIQPSAELKDRCLAPHFATKHTPSGSIKTPESESLDNLRPAAFHTPSPTPQTWHLDPVHCATPIV